MTASLRHRIGAVSFLNTVPLTYGLDQRSGLRVLFDLPSRLADRLHEGQIDVGMIPAIEYLRGVGGDLVPGICIGAQGAVHSVKVFSKVPLEEAQSIAVDRGSRSSVALLRILVAEIYGNQPDLVTVTPIAENPFLQYPSALIIGDRALQVDEKDLYVYDLGTMWHELTGLPFVFAAWVLSRIYSSDPMRSRREELISILTEAKAAGFAHLDELADEESRRTGRSAEELKSYWTHSIHYEMAEAELEGLRRFGELAHKHQLCSCRDAVRLAVA